MAESCHQRIANLSFVATAVKAWKNAPKWLQRHIVDVPFRKPRATFPSHRFVFVKISCVTKKVGCFPGKSCVSAAVQFYCFLVPPTKSCFLGRRVGSCLPLLEYVFCNMLPWTSQVDSRNLLFREWASQPSARYQNPPPICWARCTRTCDPHESSLQILKALKRREVLWASCGWWDSESHTERWIYLKHSKRNHWCAEHDSLVCISGSHTGRFNWTVQTDAFEQPTQIDSVSSSNMPQICGVLVKSNEGG